MTGASALDGVLDLVLPKRCVRCRAVGAWLCDRCARELHPIPSVRCPRCGAPGPWTASGVAGRRERAAAVRRRMAGQRSPERSATALYRCRECGGRELAFSSAAAAFAYEGPARALVGACKFRALRSLCAEMSRLAQPAFDAAYGISGAGRHAAPSAAAVDLVTWVPAHREHGLERGFNQAELLARQLAGAAGIPSAPLLRRVRHGSRQSELGRTARVANVRGAFVFQKDADRVKKNLKRVVVVDDVYTTGETVNQGAQVLVGAGLEAHVFTFARAVRSAPSQASLNNSIQKERCT